MSMLEDIYFNKLCWRENIFDTTKYSFKLSTYQGGLAMWYIYNYLNCYDFKIILTT
jgi:hypothetical protein